MGPNVKRLLIELMAADAVPPGTRSPLAAAIDSLLDLSGTAARAKLKLEAILKAVKSAADNPYGDDDEAIAAEILRRLEERKRSIQAGHK